MTVDLSSEFIETLKEVKDKYVYIRRRLNVNFKNVLGYQPDYLFFLERRPQYRLHGIINFLSKDTNKIKNILKLTLFGKRYKSSPMNKYIVSFKPLYHSLGWLGYCLKYRKISNFKTRYYANDELKRKVKKLLHTLK